MTTIVPDPLRLAALDNAALCAAMWRAHGLGVAHAHGCVACSGTPPRFYPNVVTTDPQADLRDQLGFIGERAARHAGDFFVKDSYRALPLSDLGFEPLFDAQWTHRPRSFAGPAPRLEWRPVAGADELTAWEVAWSGADERPATFLPAFLADPYVTMLAGRADNTIEAGAIVTTTEAVAGISNVFGDLADVVSAAAAAAAGRDLVGYETGDSLTAALAAGFQPLGELRVWVRR